MTTSLHLPLLPGAAPSPAVVLLSGGIDSTTCLAAATAAGYHCHALMVDYGQRHRIELDAARKVADAYHAPHITSRIDLRLFGGSALTSDIDVPKNTRAAATSLIPATYVPARNTILLALALAYAETISADHVFIGVNSDDHTGYPDCRPGYLHAFQAVADLATRSAVTGHPVTIHAPLIDIGKPAIIQLGLSLGVDYGLTWSCYDPAATADPCRRCDACIGRADGFAANHITDPLDTLGGAA